MEENWLRGRLSIFDMHKSMGPEGMHPKVLRELLLQGHSWLPLKGHGDWGMLLERGRKQRSLLSSRRVSWKCGELQDTEPHLSLREAVGRKSSLNTFSNTWRTRSLLRVVNMREYLWGENTLVQPQAFTMRSLARQIKCGEQLMFFNMTPVKSLYLCCPRQDDKVRVRKVDNDMDWKQAELLGPKSY